ncbi:MAG: hypothetical protein RIT81_34160 [Deltaproteobacteria bacterium]
MEAATSQRPQEAEPVEGAVADGVNGQACLGTLVDHWQDAGAAVPVAIVVSVFDDVLMGALESDAEDDVGLDAITVDDSGHAFVRRPVGLDGAGRLLVRALGDDVPSNAQPLVARLMDGERPIDAEQLRQWMRDALGAPASREEVQAAFVAATFDPQEAETLLPAPAPADTGDVPVVAEASAYPEPIEEDEAIEGAEAGEPVEASAPPEPVEASAPPEPSEAVATPDSTDAPESTGAPESTDAPDSTDAPIDTEVEEAPLVAEPATAQVAAAPLADRVSEPPHVYGEDDEQETLPPLPVPPLAEDDDMFTIAGEAALPPERPFSADTTIDSKPPEPSAPSVVVDGPLLDAAVAVEALSVMPPSDVVEPHPLSEAPAPAAPIDEESSSDGRRVVRYEYSPPSFAVSSAPAARRSARAAAAGPDSILVPNDRKSGIAWLLVLGAVGAVVYFLFFS